MKKAVSEKGVYSFICPSDSTRFHDHAYFEISYVLSGKAVHVIEGNDGKEIKEGDYFIIDLKTRHKYTTTTPGKLVIINTMFMPDFLDPMLVGCNRISDQLNCMFARNLAYTKVPDISDRIFHDDTGKIKELLEKIQKEFKNGSFGYIENIRCLLKELIIETVRKTDIPKRSAQNDQITAPVRKYINKNYNKAINLEELCSKMGYSLSHISRKFKEENGMTFKEYLQKIRIAESCRLLLSTNYTVIEIAERVGYSNIKFFNQIFKEYTGKTPKEFRTH